MTGAVIILFIAIVAALLAIKHGKNSSHDPFCVTCGHSGATKTRTKGSIVIEAILWLCLLVPGLIYSVWRMSSRYDICASCGSDKLVPPTSPVALKMRKELAAA